MSEPAIPCDLAASSRDAGSLPSGPDGSVDGPRDVATADIALEVAAPDTADAFDAGIEADARADAGPGYYVDPLRGDDITHAGTYDAPFRTIAKALSLARRGDHVYLFDGTYGSGSEPSFIFGNPLVLADGVSLEALTPGGALLITDIAEAEALHFAGDARIAGLRFRGFAVAIRADGGTLVVERSKFESGGRKTCGSKYNRALVVLGGTAHLTLRPMDTDPVGEGTSCLVRVADRAALDVEGGTLEDSVFESPPNFNAVLTALGEGSITVQGTSFRGHQQDVVGAWDAASIVVKGAQFVAAAPKRDASGTLLRATDRVSIRVDDSNFEGDRHNCVGIYKYVDREGPRNTIVMNDDVLEHCNTGLSSGSGSSPTATLRRVTFESGGDGISFMSGGTLDFRGGRIADHGFAGIQIVTGAHSSITLRDVTIERSGSYGVHLSGGVDKVDLGRGNDPGGNVIRGSNWLGQGYANLMLEELYGEGPAAFAVGDTWDANAQGSDEQGRYDVPSGGRAVEVMSGAGQNYKLVREYSPTFPVLRLAELPCLADGTCD